MRPGQEGEKHRPRPVQGRAMTSGHTKEVQTGPSSPVSGGEKALGGRTRPRPPSLLSPLGLVAARSHWRRRLRRTSWRCRLFFCLEERNHHAIRGEQDLSRGKKKSQRNLLATMQNGGT